MMKACCPPDPSPYFLPSPHYFGVSQLHVARNKLCMSPFFCSCRCSRANMDPSKPFKVCLNNTLWGKSTTFEKVDLLSNPAAICQRRICHCPRKNERKKERKTLLDIVDASQIHTDVLTDTLVCLVKYTKHFFSLRSSLDRCRRERQKRKLAHAQK